MHRQKSVKLKFEAKLSISSIKYKHTTYEANELTVNMLLNHKIICFQILHVTGICFYHFSTLASVAGLIMCYTNTNFDRPINFLFALSIIDMTINVLLVLALTVIC